MARIKRRALHAESDREHAIQLAIDMVGTVDKSARKKSVKKVSIRGAAEAHGIPFSTLYDRIRGVTTNRKSHTKQQLLSPTDEKAVIRWIKDLEQAGFPPRMDHVRQAATLIAGKPPGTNWITRFLNRHPELAARFTTTMDKDRIHASTPQIIRKHFKDLKEVLKGVENQDIWNMDEKGFLMGLAKRLKVICTYRQGNFPVADDGNRELLTCIESVSAAGVVLPPLIIYKGAAHYLGWHKFTGSHTSSQEFHFSHSKRGWTNRILAMEWLTKIFEPQTMSSGRTRVLIVDGHDSHVTIEFIRFCVKSSIRLYCLPPHTTHLLQPLDVGLFGPLQHAYSKAVDDAMRTGVSGIFKGNFLPLYISARKAAYTMDNILNAWRGAGIIPFNSRAILSKIDSLTKKSFMKSKDLTEDPFQPSKPLHSEVLSTPRDSKAASQLVRQKKLLLQQALSPTQREDILNQLVDHLHRFGIAKERDYQLVDHTFTQWRQANQLNTQKSTKKLGKGLKGALDGETLESLVNDRLIKDQLDAETSSARTAKKTVLDKHTPHPKKPQVHFEASQSPSRGSDWSDSSSDSDSSTHSTITLRTPITPRQEAVFSFPHLISPTPGPSQHTRAPKNISPTPLAPRRVLRPRK